MQWDKLSMADKAKYIELGVSNGITNLSVIKDTYNKYDEGGPKKTVVRDRRTGEELVFDTRKEADEYISSAYSDPTFYQGELPELVVNARQPRGLLEQGAANFEDTFGMTPRDAAGFIPYVGDALDIKDIAQDIKDQKYKEALIAAGLLVVPNAVENIAKGIYRGAKNIRRTLELNAGSSLTNTEKLHRLLHPNRTAKATSSIYGSTTRIADDKSLEELEKLAEQMENVRARLHIGNDLRLSPSTNSEAQLADLNTYASRVENYAKSYKDKMKALEANPILYDMAQQSPQYVDDIYDDFISGRITDIEDYVRSQIIRANTFYRRMDPSRAGKRSFTEEDFLNIGDTRGRGIGGKDVYTPGSRQLNVGNYRVVSTGNYGDEVGIYKPKDLALEGDVSTWWSQRKPNIEGITVHSGMHNIPNDPSRFTEGLDYLPPFWSTKSGRGLLRDLGVPPQYGGDYSHIVFNWEPDSPVPPSIADKFVVDLDNYFNLSPDIRKASRGYKRGGKLIHKKC